MAVRLVRAGNRGLQEQAISTDYGKLPDELPAELPPKTIWALELEEQTRSTVGRQTESQQ